MFNDPIIVVLGIIVIFTIMQLLAARVALDLSSETYSFTESVLRGLLFTLLFGGSFCLAFFIMYQL